MPNLALDLVVERVDLVDEGANTEAFIKLYKRKEIEQDMTLEEILAKMKPEHATVIQDALQKSKGEVPTETAQEVETLKGKISQLETELTAAKEAAPVAKSKEQDFEETLKSLDPSVQEVFKSLKAQKDAAEAVAREAADKAVTDAAVAKAKELKAIPVEEAKLVDVLKGASTGVVEILTAAAAALENGAMFDEVGKGKGDKPATTSQEAWDKIEKKAGEIVDRDKVSKEMAVAKAIREYPELYRAYLDGGAN